MKWTETERLIIRDLEERDLETFASYRMKKEVAEYQSWDSYSLYEAKDLYKRLQISPFNGKTGMTQLAIERKEDHQLIGDLYLKIDFFKRHELFLGYTLDSLYWGKGYATEAVKAICDYAFSQLSVKQVVCYVLWENKRSARVLEKNGFIQFASSVMCHDYAFKLKKPENP